MGKLNHLRPLERCLISFSDTAKTFWPWLQIPLPFLFTTGTAYVFCVAIFSWAHVQTRNFHPPKEVNRATATATSFHFSFSYELQFLLQLWWCFGLSISNAQRQLNRMRFVHAPTSERGNGHTENLPQDLLINFPIRGRHLEPNCGDEEYTESYFLGLEIF